MQAPTASAQPKVSPAALAAALSGLWSEITRSGAGGWLAVIDELDVSITQMKTLHVLDACGCELSVKDLAERLGLSLPGASRTVEGLLRRGWLERREDAADRRVRRVGITALGREAVGRIEAARHDGIEAWAAGLEPEQRARLMEALPR